MLIDQCFDFQTNQFIQTHIQNRIGLLLGKHQLGRHDLGFLGLKLDAVNPAFDKTCLCHSPVFGTAQDLDDQIDHVARFDQAFLDFLTFQFPGQKIGILSGGNLILELYTFLYDLL